MAGSKSDYLEKVVLDLVLGGVTFTPLSTVYVALSLAAYDDAATGTAMGEVSTIGTGYARVASTNNTTNWPPASGTNPSTKNNGTSITFPTGTGPWGEVRSFYLVDNAVGGNVLYGGDLNTPKPILAGDTATFAANSITVTED